MINKRKIKKMKGFSLIELLAVIAVLAIIALISIPIVINIINNSKKEAFKNGVYSVYNAYEFAEASEDFETIEKADISDLDLSNERFSIGSIKRNNNKQIEVINLSDGAYCANGTLDDLTIIDGDCSSLDETAPIISNVTIEKTTSSVKVIVSFSEPDSTIKNYDFRLLDSEGNVVVDWSKGDNLSGNGLKRVATKTFDNLTQGKECKVIVRIQNNSGNQYDTITAEQIVILNSIATPEIVYDTTKYSYNKEVTLNYDSKVKSEYKVVDENSETVIGWTKLEGTSTKITIHNYNYTVLVRSSDGTTTLSNSSQIGYIDYTKPIVTISDISSDWGTSDEITLNMTDNLSGVISWCVTDASNSNLCDWKIITNTLNGTASYTLNTNGTYYAFIKDNVGNISDSYQFKITKVDTEVPEVPSITASDSIASENWHKDDYILRFSGAESISGIEYYYGTNINDMVLSGDSVRILENTIMTTYYVKACNGAGLCSSTTSYVAKLDKIIPNNPIIATSDCIESDDWHTADYSLVFSNSASTSNVTYYYGTEQNNLSLIGTGTNISSETSGTTYYVKACNEVNRCSEVVTYISKVDKTKPTGVYATVVSSTTKSLTISASGNDSISGIAKYEFSKDNGATWVDNGSNNVYTFENLTTGTYTVKVRVTNNALLIQQVNQLQKKLLQWLPLLL